MKLLLAGLLASAVFAFSTQAFAQSAPTPDPDNTILMETSKGNVKILMRPDLAPNHVAQIKALVKQGFYNGITFHRVMEGFMAQTGDPKGDGTGGSGTNIKAEFTDEPFVRGTVGMARSGHPDSASSQFFIMFAEGSFLNGQYTVWGEVIEGMDNVDEIKRGVPGSGTVQGQRDSIVSMQMMSDIPQ